MAKKQTGVDRAELYKSSLSWTLHADSEFSRGNYYFIKNKISSVAISHSIDKGLWWISQVKVDEFLKLSVAKWTWKKNKNLPLILESQKQVVTYRFTELIGLNSVFR
jgi:hypothetical protein